MAEWTLVEVPITCPKCHWKMKWDLTTSYLAGPASGNHSYQLEERIWELMGRMTGLIDEPSGVLRGFCPHCDSMVAFGAKIKNEAITKVFIIREGKK